MTEGIKVSVLRGKFEEDMKPWESLVLSVVEEADTLSIQPRIRHGKMLGLM